ncbi:hypothetical protein DRO56_01135 [Candidatus Bathyarchaeota archaeon]|nr:MAG: hypothetical protein DRO56_01135 [Candidatus Bathyarchaeota archaeon]
MPRSLIRRLLSRDSAPLLVVLLWSVALLLSTSTTTHPTLRWLISIPYLVFAPGYGLLTLLKGTREIDVAEGLALSLGLSLCLVGLMGLVLSLTPVGITSSSVAASVTAFTLGALAASVYLRRLRGAR